MARPVVFPENGIKTLQRMTESTIYMTEIGLQVPDFTVVF